MKTTRKVSRRSFFLTVAGGVAAAGTLGLIAPTEAQAMQCTDSDTGGNSDPAGGGRRCGTNRSTGCTDRDTGRYSDPAGNGRCRRRTRTGCTDRDTGRYGDPAGNGRCRRRRSCTDSDTGRYGDPAGRGRRC